MLGHLSWKSVLQELAIVFIPALILAAITGQVLFCLLIATLILLFWHIYCMIKLSRWLWIERRFFPPEGKGSWVNIFYGIHKLRLHQRKQRKYLTTLLNDFRKAAEAIPDAVIICRIDEHVVWCNKQAELLLGLKWPQDKNQLISNIIRLPEFTHYLKERNFENPLILHIASQKVIEFRLLYPYIENDLLILARDITEKHRSEKIRQIFFDNVSHELRIPLTVIQGYLEILNSAEEDLSPIQKKAYQSMSNQVKRLDSLASQLTTLSKIEGTFNLDMIKKVAVSDLINTILDSLVIFSTKKQIIEADIEPDIYVMGDEEQLRSTISNLIYNAVEHNQEGTTIEISWHRLKGVPTNAIFSVKDNGKGIPNEHLTHLTERFYRVDSSRSRQSGGTGLGLAIVKHALNNHHSSLEIYSEVGKGSQFQFTLTVVA